MSAAHNPAVTYRARAVPPASDWGRFLVRMRQEKDWSAVQAHEALHDGLGLRLKSKASYTALEDGKAPSPAQERFLREFFHDGPTEADRDPMAGTGGDTPAVPAAYLERIDALLVTVGQLIEQNAALMQAFGLGPPPPDVQTVIEEASEQRRSASTLRPADPAPRKAPRSQVRSEG